MILALVMAASMLFGFALAEAWRRLSNARAEKTRRRNALLAEYLEKQLWQFISINEWLEGNQQALAAKEPATLADPDHTTKEFL